MLALPAAHAVVQARREVLSSDDDDDDDEDAEEEEEGEEAEGGAKDMNLFADEADDDSEVYSDPE